MREFEHSSLSIHIEMAILDIANCDLTVASWAAILSELQSYKKNRHILLKSSLKTVWTLKWVN